MTFDFTSAKLKHSRWKLQLRDFLDGKGQLTAQQAVSHRDCDLGKWLYADGLAKYGSIPEMKALEQEHEALHRTIKMIIELKKAGKSKESENAFRQVDPISRRIVELLDAVEAKVESR